MSVLLFVYSGRSVQYDSKPLHVQESSIAAARRRTEGQAGHLAWYSDTLRTASCSWFGHHSQSTPNQYWGSVADMWRLRLDQPLVHTERRDLRDTRSQDIQRARHTEHCGRRRTHYCVHQPISDVEGAQRGATIRLQVQRLQHRAGEVA